MVRPQKNRRVGACPRSTYYKPAGIPLRELEEVVLNYDELEAIRLCNYEGLYQEQAAEKMGVSRPTLSRILQRAYHKVADVFTNGKALRIDGGNVLEIHPNGGRGRCAGRGRGQGRRKKRGIE